MLLEPKAPNAGKAGAMFAAPLELHRRIVAECSRSEQRLFWHLWGVRDHNSSLARFIRGGTCGVLGMKRSTFSGALAGLVSRGLVRRLDPSAGGRDDAGCELVQLASDANEGGFLFEPAGQKTEQMFENLNECSENAAADDGALRKRARACMEGHTDALAPKRAGAVVDVLAVMASDDWAETARTKGVRVALEEVGAWGRVVDAVVRLGVDPDELVTVARSVSKAPVQRSPIWMLIGRLTERRGLKALPGFERRGSEFARQVGALRAVRAGVGRGGGAR